MAKLKRHIFSTKGNFLTDLFKNLFYKWGKGKGGREKGIKFENNGLLFAGDDLAINCLLVMK